MEELAWETIIIFLVSLVISAIIIYVVTKVFREKEGFGTALLAAFVGSIIYAMAYYLLPDAGWIGSVIAGVTWLIALRFLYGIGWLKALMIAIFVWIIAAIVSIVIPTATGPL